MTTTRLGGLLDCPPGSSVVAYLDHTIALGIGGDHVGLIKSNKEDRVLDGLASGGKGSKGRHQLDCIRGKGP